MGSPSPPKNRYLARKTYLFDHFKEYVMEVLVYSCSWMCHCRAKCHATVESPLYSTCMIFHYILISIISQPMQNWPSLKWYEMIWAPTCRSEIHPHAERLIMLVCWQYDSSHPFSKIKQTFLFILLQIIVITNWRSSDMPQVSAQKLLTA